MPLLCLKVQSRGFRFDVGRSATSTISATWLETTDWDKDSEPPKLPEDIIQRTRAKYIEAFELLVGEAFPWT